jgi:hypothetical protein
MDPDRCVFVVAEGYPKARPPEDTADMAGASASAVFDRRKPLPPPLPNRQ